MDVNQIIHIALLLLSAVMGGVALYLRTKSGLTAKIGEFIAQAEEAYVDSTQAGGQKFAWVVDSLYALVPTPFKFFLTRAFIGTLVQNAFDSIAHYAKQQLDKAGVQPEPQPMR